MPTREILKNIKNIKRRKNNYLTITFCHLKIFICFSLCVLFLSISWLSRSCYRFKFLCALYKAAAKRGRRLPDVKSQKCTRARAAFLQRTKLCVPREREREKYEIRKIFFFQIVTCCERCASSFPLRKISCLLPLLFPSPSKVLLCNLTMSLSEVRQ